MSRGIQYFFIFSMMLSLLAMSGCKSEMPTESGSIGSMAGTTETNGSSDAFPASSVVIPAGSVAVGDTVELNGRQWEVTFSDDFNGIRLDSKNWTYSQAVERGDFGNNYWSRKQVFLEGDGFLRLGIDYDEETDRILSGAITSDRVFEQTYGYFECRAKLQAASGCWSAFWIMSNDIQKVGNGGKDGAEIDIFESPWFNQGVIQSAIHWDGYGEAHQSLGSPQYHLPDMYYDFHTFALEWTETEYIFYVDGQESWRTDAGGICQVPCYLQLSVEAGTWGGEFIKEQMPACFTVDYVRVYKQV